MYNEKNHSAQDIKKILNWIQKYTQGFQCKDDQKAPIAHILKGLLFSLDYSLCDFIAIVKNVYEKNTSLLRELITIDLTDTLSDIQVPYYIIQGNTDIVTSTKAISEFVAISKNNNLNCVVIENSGYFLQKGQYDYCIAIFTPILARIIRSNIYTCNTTTF